MQIENSCLRENAVINRDRLEKFLHVAFIKATVDKVVAFAAIVFFGPLLALVAIMIKLDSPGPIFFKQKRTGFLGRRFTLYKFRTMEADAEERKQELATQNIFGPGSPDFKLRSDPRVTRIGSFLRKTSIDEIPNLINVILGDMALVGPRPTSFSIETYGSEHLYRLAVKPGITGLWQISGRADVDFDERVRLDIEYINNVSVKSDIIIVIKTMKQLLKPVGAY